MCFRNLPIEVDAHDRARLKPDAAQPYSLAQAPPRKPGPAPKPRRDIREVDFHTVTRASDETTIDLHELIGLVERGCPVDTAVRIAAPLDRHPA